MVKKMTVMKRVKRVKIVKMMIKDVLSGVKLVLVDVLVMVTGMDMDTDTDMDMDTVTDMDMDSVDSVDTVILIIIPMEVAVVEATMITD